MQEEIPDLDLDEAHRQVMSKDARGVFQNKFENIAKEKLSDGDAMKAMIDRTLKAVTMLESGSTVGQVSEKLGIPVKDIYNLARDMKKRITPILHGTKKSQLERKKKRLARKAARKLNRNK